MDEGSSSSPLSATLARRNKVHERIIRALEHWPRDRAMSCIMMWLSINELEEAAKTICKDLED